MDELDQEFEQLIDEIYQMIEECHDLLKNPSEEGNTEKEADASEIKGPPYYRDLNPSFSLRFISTVEKLIFRSLIILLYRALRSAISAPF